MLKWFTQTAPGAGATSPRPRLRVGRILLGVYLAVLLVSTGVRLAQPAEQPLAPGQQAVRVPAIDHDRPTAQQVRLAYFEYGDPARPTLILLHGMPGAGSEFDRPEFGGTSEGIGRVLGQRYHVLAPDLPGLGTSSHAIPDYSFRAHAFYVLALMDQLHIARAHLLGFSQGGGVAISLLGIAPQRVASVVLASAIGVQELELLGDYYLNRPVYLAQLAFTELLQNGLPHFGAFDRFGVVNAARNFLESDQRPLRGFLAHYDGPLLIIQGASDGQVPPEVGREHARIVPQSELALLDGGHMMLESDHQVVSAIVLPFLDRAAAGAATTRATADPARIAQAQPPFDRHRLPKLVGVANFSAVILLIVLAFFGAPVACVSAGVLVAQGRIDISTALIGCILGLTIWGVLRFGLGRRLGAAGGRRAPWRWLRAPNDELPATDWSVRHYLSAAARRVLPSARFGVDIALGAAGWRWRRWLLLLGATVLCAALLVGVAALLADVALRVVVLNSIALQLGVVAALVGALLGSLVWLAGTLRDGLKRSH